MSFTTKLNYNNYQNQEKVTKMWYRKAMDLNDLNKDFALERENVIDAVEEENTKQNVEDLFSKVRAGEQYTSSSGAIKVMPPREEPPFTDEEVDGKFDSESTDAYDVYEGIKDFPSTVTTLKNTANTISRYIDSGVLQEFNRKIDSLKNASDRIIKGTWLY